jgi:hypothetical protein
MNAREHLEALTATVGRLEASGVRILEARYEQPSSWCLAVEKGAARIEVFWEGDSTAALSMSRLRRSELGVEYWDKPELIDIPPVERSIQQLMIRAEREILTRTQNA